MLSFIISPIRQLMQLFKSHDSAYQVAFGVTLGAIIGVMPKGNLIVVCLGVLLCAVHVNKSAGLIAIGIFSWLAPLVDPIAHTLGLRLLEMPSMQGSFAWLYDQPLGPWLGFNNTVVLGTFLLGIYFSYPVFWVSYVGWSRISSRIAERQRQRAVGHLAAGMKLGAPWETAV